MDYSDSYSESSWYSDQYDGSSSDDDNSLAQLVRHNRRSYNWRVDIPIAPYKPGLTLLPKPEWMKSKLEKETELVAPQIVEEEVVVSSPPVAESPWKKIDPTNVSERDPWAFLEPPPKPEPRTAHRDRRRTHDSRNQRRQSGQHQHQQTPVAPSHTSPATGQSPPPISLLSTIDNTDTNRLCKYRSDCRMNKDGRCGMVHTLEEWKPRICRFKNRCSRKMSCGYHHPDVPIKDYLSCMIKRADSIYQKNAILYEKYLR